MPLPMVNLQSAVVVAFLMLSIVLAAAVWIYSDAKKYAVRGNPIVVSWGTFHLSTPVAWFFACLLLGELFVPLYIDTRRQRAPHGS